MENFKVGDNVRLTEKGLEYVRNYYNWLDKFYGILTIVANDDRKIKVENKEGYSFWTDNKSHLEHIATVKNDLSKEANPFLSLVETEINLYEAKVRDLNKNIEDNKRYLDQLKDNIDEKEKNLLTYESFLDMLKEKHNELTNKEKAKSSFEITDHEVKQVVTDGKNTSTFRIKF